MRLVQGMYSNARSRVPVGEGYSEEFEVKVGVHQGLDWYQSIKYSNIVKTIHRNNMYIILFHYSSIHVCPVTCEYIEWAVENPPMFP